MPRPEVMTMGFRSGFSPVRSNWKFPSRVLLAFLLAAGFSSGAPAQDITSQIVANDNIALAGNAMIGLTGGTTTYTATTGISGAGTLEISGTGTLVLEQTNTFTLPTVGESVAAGPYISNPSYYSYEGYTANGFIGYVYTLHNPDPPAVTIDSGVTLQWGTSSVAGSIEDASGNGANLDNILDNGLLNLNDSNTIGVVSGTGSLQITIGAPYMYGTSTLSGAVVIENNETLYLGTDHLAGAIPDAKVVFDNGTFILNAPYTQSSTITQNIYENHFGNDININPNGGLVTLTGVYSYSDAGNGANQFAPSLTKTADNYTFINGNASGRGINIEGGILQLGNGATTSFFLPGNPFNTYLNLHKSGILGFDYSNSAPTYMNTTIAGGQITFATFSAPGTGVVILHQGDLVVTQQQYYNGTTQIDSGGTLQLGDGTHGDMTGTITAGNLYETSDGDGDLMQAGQSVTVGTTQGTNQGTSTSTGLSTNNLVNNGALIVDNVGATEFLNVSGSGKVVQAGAGTTTLYANTTYTGKTTITGGTLAIGSGGSIATSSGVDLETTPSSLVAGPQDTKSTVATPGAATFDISQAGNQTMQDLSGAGGTLVALGGNTLTVGTANSTTYGGVIADGGIGGGKGGGLTKVGTGTWTLSGTSSFAGDMLLQRGSLLVGGSITNGGSFEAQSATTLQLSAGTITTSAVQIDAGATMTGCGTINGSLSNQGTVLINCSNGLTVNGGVENGGTMRFINGSALRVSGQFTNTGLLDLITGTQSLPANFVNTGIVLDSSLVRVQTVALAGSGFTVTILGYAGHGYQLQSTPSLTAPDWQAIGSVQSVANSQSKPLTLTFIDSSPSSSSGFYRIVVAP
jgi:autotransporter-associated beta strand protein